MEEVALQLLPHHSFVSSECLGFRLKGSCPALATIAIFRGMVFLAVEASKTPFL